MKACNTRYCIAAKPPQLPRSADACRPRMHAAGHADSRPPPAGAGSTRSCAEAPGQRGDEPAQRVDHPRLDRVGDDLGDELGLQPAASQEREATCGGQPAPTSAGLPAAARAAEPANAAAWTQTRSGWSPLHSGTRARSERSAGAGLHLGSGNRAVPGRAGLAWLRAAATVRAAATAPKKWAPAPPRPATPRPPRL